MTRQSTRGKIQNLQACLKKSLDININPEILPGRETIKDTTDEAVQRLGDEVASWNVKPPAHMYCALRVMALQLCSEVVWNARSNILVAKILYAVGGHEVRGHSSGLYEYVNGAFLRRQVLPE